MIVLSSLIEYSYFLLKSDDASDIMVTSLHSNSFVRTKENKSKVFNLIGTFSSKAPQKTWNRKRVKQHWLIQSRCLSLVSSQTHITVWLCGHLNKLTLWMFFLNKNIKKKRTKADCTITESKPPFIRPSMKRAVERKWERRRRTNKGRSV